MKLSYSELKGALREFEKRGYLQYFTHPLFAKLSIGNFLLRHPLEDEQDLLANQYFFDAVDINQSIAMKLIKEGDLNLLTSEIKRLICKLNTKEIVGTLAEDRLPELLKDLNAKCCFGETIQSKGIENSKIKKANNSLKDHGYAIIEDAIDPSICSEIMNEINFLSHKEITDGTAYKYGNQQLLQRIYHLIIKSQRCRDLFKNNLLRGVLDNFFERQTNHDLYYLSTFVSHILYPGAKSQKLHTDENTDNPLTPWPMRIDANFILHDYTIDSGATIVYPGTHKLLRKPTKDEREQEVITIGDKLYKPIKILAPAGSIAFWTGKVWHKSGTNNGNTPRTAMLACFCSSILREMSCEENNIRLLQQLESNGSNTLDKYTENLLGFNHGVKDKSLIQ